MLGFLTISSKAQPLKSVPKRAFHHFLQSVPLLSLPWGTFWLSSFFSVCVFSDVKITFDVKFDIDTAFDFAVGLALVNSTIIVANFSYY